MTATIDFNRAALEAAIRADQPAVTATTIAAVIADVDRTRAYFGAVGQHFGVFEGVSGHFSTRTTARIMRAYRAAVAK